VVFPAPNSLTTLYLASDGKSDSDLQERSLQYHRLTLGTSLQYAVEAQHRETKLRSSSHDFRSEDTLCHGTARYNRVLNLDFQEGH